MVTNITIMARRCLTSEYSGKNSRNSIQKVPLENSIGSPLT